MSRQLVCSSKFEAELESDTHCFFPDIYEVPHMNRVYDPRSLGNVQRVKGGGTISLCFIRLHLT